MPSHIVTVQFEAGPADGHLIHKMDGSTWLRASGADYRLDGSEVIVGKLAGNGDRSEIEIMADSWRGITPFILITMVLFGFLGAPRQRNE